MLEFIEVPQGTIFPHACVACMGTKGPMLDTHRELPVYGRVYVCVPCTRRLATVSGLLSAEDADALSDALARAATSERERDEADRRRTAAEASLEERLDRVVELAEAVSVRDQRIAQLEERIADTSRAALELVSHE